MCHRQEDRGNEEAQIKDDETLCLYVKTMQTVSEYLSIYKVSQL